MIKVTVKRKKRRPNMVKAIANERGFLICPKCGQKTNTKVDPTTTIYAFPLWCGKCKRETEIEYRQSHGAGTTR